jgi:asparagine synthase (glutamine-hydrolysing)
MCGIVGIVHHAADRPVSKPLLQRMCDAIRHRGPDDEGLHVEGAAGLGMRRLSIIDLAGGHQPVYNEDKSCAIVFNGEIYNYRELRDGLVKRGHVMTTHSDTETIVHLYEEMGERCLEPLRGMFALAIWDARRRRLLLARDRFGIKPLYVVEAPWGLAFASELKALVAAGLTSRSLDWGALDAYFQLGYIPAPLSVFGDVRKLEPGFTLTWEQGKGATRRRYWDLPKERRPTPRDVEERVVAWLDESVRAHLVSDVPVAAFLSGGLDSSAVVASMALAGEVPHAFTARYHGTSAAMADESGLARQLVDRYGAKLTVIDVHPELTRIFEPIVFALDEPHADESAVPSWLISEAVGSQYKVALTGTGGDELFAGYRRHLGLLLGGYARRVPGPIRRAASAVANALPEPRGGGLGVDRVKRFLRTGEAEVPDRLLGYFSRVSGGLRARLYAPAMQAQIVGNAALDRYRSVHAEGGFDGSLSAGLYLDYKTYLPDDILALSDRMAMAHSLEIRVPFADHVLLEQVFPLPDGLKVGFGKSKRLLRRALKDRLPEAHFSAPKRGFVGPTASWLRHELRAVVQDELSEARMRRLGYFDAGTVGELQRDHYGGRHNREGILWELLCFSTWHRLYVESPGTTPPAYGQGAPPLTQ